MASPSSPIFDIQPVIASTQLVNVHVINNRDYHVLRRSICYEGVELVSLHSSVISSCICGEGIAMILENGELVVCSLIAKGAVQYHLIRSERPLGIFTGDLFHKSVVATPNGRFVAVNPIPTELVVFEVFESSLEYVRSMDLPDSIHQFQLSGDTTPYVWIMSASSSQGLHVNLYNLNPALPVTYPEKPMAQCPLAELNGVKRRHLRSEDIKIFTLKNGKIDGTLCMYGSEAWHVNFKSLIIGDLLNGCKKIDGQVMAICPVYHNNNDSGPAIHLYMLHEGYISDIEGSERMEVPSRWRGYDSSAWESNFFVVKPENKQVFFKPRHPLNILNFTIDMRKHPWKIITVGKEGVSSLGSAKSVTAEHTGIYKMSKLHYVPGLTMLILSNSQYDSLCLVPPGRETPTFKQMALISVGLMGKHTLVQVYPKCIDFHSAFQPYPFISSMNSAESILGASITENFCYYYTYDSIFSLYFQTGDANPSNDLIFSGFPITFCRPTGDRIIAFGVDLSLPSNVYKLQKEYDSFVQRYMKPTKRPFGAILLLDTSCNTVIDVQYHSQIPTGWCKFANGWEFSLYGAVGKLCWVNESVGLIENEVPALLEWVAVHPNQDGVFLRGTCIYVASSGSCTRLAPNSKTNGFISSAILIDEKTLAYIEKQELKILHEDNFFSKQLPIVLKSKEFSTNTVLKPLLIESQRVLILHGGNTCNFMDSETFEPIMVSGLVSAWYDAIAVWNFSDNGENYEHLLFSDGRGGLHSYTYRRKGLTMTLTQKYCSSFSNSSNISSDSNQQILTWKSHVILTGGRVLKQIMPMQNKIISEICLAEPCKHVSLAANYLIITESTHILILKLDNNRELLRIRKISSESLEISKSSSFVTHAAQHVQKQSGGSALYIIVYTVDAKLRKTETLGIYVDLESADYELIRVPLDVRRNIPDLKIKCLQPDPDAPLQRDFLRAYAVLRDDSIYKVELKPQGMQTIIPANF